MDRRTRMLTARAVSVLHFLVGFLSSVTSFNPLAALSLVVSLFQVVLYPLGSKNVDIVLYNARLPHPDPKKEDSLWRVECLRGHIVRIVEQLSSRPLYLSSAQGNGFDCKGALVLPSLCHPHIHLDKCFILSHCSHLIRGDFAEAMELTARAKASFPKTASDLNDRGMRLVLESLECGVTSMRAHVEVDAIVGLLCLRTALKLKQHFNGTCDMQIAAFAQEPLFLSANDTTHGPNYEILRKAVAYNGVDVVGSAPYVEPSIELAKRNIRLVLELASRHGLHADFHLDYNINPESEPLIFEVISQVRALMGHWKKTHDAARPRITVGHATRLQLFSPDQWRQLITEVGDLPIHIVGLPQSDMYMLGTEERARPVGTPRSTLRVPQLARDYGFQVAMGVNNVDNPFTPQGSLDPLSLCTFGVAVFQAATTEDIQILARSVSVLAKTAIGMKQDRVGLFPESSQAADFVILHANDNLRSAVLNPSYDRTTIRAGQIVAQRRTRRWVRVSRKMTQKNSLFSWSHYALWLAPLALFVSYPLYLYCTK